MFHVEHSCLSTFPKASLVWDRIKRTSFPSSTNTGALSVRTAQQVNSSTPVSDNAWRPRPPIVIQKAILTPSTMPYLLVPPFIRSNTTQMLRALWVDSFRAARKILFPVLLSLRLISSELITGTRRGKSIRGQILYERSWESQ